MTNPIVPSSKRQKKDKDDIPLSSVLEWFDTTMKPSTMICREKEKEVLNIFRRNREQEITEFIDGCLKEQKGGSIYICGSPGIGKSLLISKLLDEIKKKKGVWIIQGDDMQRGIKEVYINAMTVQKNQVSIGIDSDHRIYTHYWQNPYWMRKWYGKKQSRRQRICY